MKAMDKKKFLLAIGSIFVTFLFSVAFGYGIDRFNGTHGMVYVFPAITMTIGVVSGLLTWWKVR